MIKGPYFYPVLISKKAPDGPLVCYDRNAFFTALSRRWQPFIQINMDPKEFNMVLTIIPYTSKFDYKLKLYYHFKIKKINFSNLNASF
jgi:hypothetical protein